MREERRNQRNLDMTGEATETEERHAKGRDKSYKTEEKSDERQEKSESKAR